MRRPFTVTPGFLLGVLAVWFIDRQLLLPAALAALLHELGHALALGYMRRPLRGLRLTGGGLALSFGGPPLSYRAELPAALSGPAVSLLSAWLAARLGFYLFAGVSLALGVFNLLPVPPLDGGRAWSALCALLLPPAAALAVSRWTGVAVAGLAMGLALGIFRRMGGLPLVFVGGWLVLHALRWEKDT